MKLLTKPLETLVLKDTLEIEQNPENFESFQIEYKIKFDGDTSELRKDIIQFANSEQDGLVIFGIQNDPIKIIGIEQNEIDGLKTVLNGVLTKRITPILSPFPKFRAIQLENKKYIFLIKIVAKNTGIYAICGNNNPSHRDYYKYEFWTRLDGNKHRMKIEEVVSLIERKKKQVDKDLEVKFQAVIIPNIRKGLQFCVKAVNKSTRPIKITSYGLKIVNSGFEIVIIPNSIQNVGICSSLPKMLHDGEDCIAFYPKSNLTEDLKLHNLKYPVRLQGWVNTNDGMFFSDISDLIPTD